MRNKNQFKTDIKGLIIGKAIPTRYTVIAACGPIILQFSSSHHHILGNQQTMLKETPSIYR